jgi:hypothetical protein
MIETTVTCPSCDEDIDVGGLNLYDIIEGDECDTVLEVVQDEPLTFQVLAEEDDSEDDLDFIEEDEESCEEEEA